MLITLVGWFLLLGGLSRMFAPEYKPAVQNAVGVFALQMVLLAAGIVLTFKAYTRDVSETGQ